MKRGMPIYFSKNAGATLMLLCAFSGIILLSACSTVTNTAGSRFYHATTAHFNTYYNGKEAFNKGYDSQEKAMKVNWLEYPSMNPVTDAKTTGTGKTSYQTAIDKAKKCIKLHSITAKPKKKPGKTLTPKERKWYAKSEYNPFLWKAWMLMADAQAQTGDFIEAASTYSYIANMYADEPSVAAEALSKTAWCYSQLDWYYEADEMFSRTAGLKTGIQTDMNIKALRAQSLIHQQRYEESLPLLEQSINRRGLSRSQRIRERYLLAQLYRTAGRNSDAARSFGQVIRMNPSYDIEFQARIRQTETMASGQNSRKAMKKLGRMLRDPKYKELQDQIYYAMGNIRLIAGDTVSALRLYGEGAVCNDRSAPDKGILLLTMADIYWNMADYENAGHYYSQAVGMINGDHREFQTVKLRSSQLEQLSSHLGAVHLQDSLQRLATLPEPQVLQIIDSIIENLITAEAEKHETGNEKTTDAPPTTEVEKTGAWYFYNSQAVQRGKDDFFRQWGDRRLEDNWRRSNRSVLAYEDSDNMPLTDSVRSNGLMQDVTAADSAAADTMPGPLSREYYLAMIPYSAGALEKSDRIITSNLLAAGLIFNNDLDEHQKAGTQLWRIALDYPESDEADQALYFLFLMYSHIGNVAMADSCTDRLQRLYADRQYTIMLTDSSYLDNARYGRQREDSIYAQTYQAFRNGDTTLVIHGCHVSETLFPTGQNRPRFMFLHAATQLQNGNLNSFLSELRELVGKYPDESISQFAGLIVQGIQDGRIIKSGSLFSIWERNGTEGLIPDSLKPAFNNDRLEPYQFILAYPEGELNENQLLFEMANYNFSNYTMRNFDLAFSKEHGIGMLTVGKFLNFDEAYTYSRKLYSDPDMAQKLEGINALVISGSNLEILLKYYSFNDWQQYYEENFLNIPQFEIDGSTLFEELDNATEPES